MVKYSLTFCAIRVKFTRRLDKLAPQSLISVKGGQALRVEVENYGREWYLVSL